jgi:hypothetical protein
VKKTKSPAKDTHTHTHTHTHTYIQQNFGKYATFNELNEQKNIISNNLLELETHVKNVSSISHIN